MPAAQNAVLSAVAATEIGKASGIFYMFRFLGRMFAAIGSVGPPEAFNAGFAAAIGVTAALSLLGAVAGLWQPGRRAGALGTRS